MGVSVYQDTLTGALDVFGWHWMHVRPIFDARAKRWVTPTTAKGWPDLTCLHTRSGVVLACEVKGQRKNPKPHQREWLERWHRVPCAAAVVFGPTDDWHQVVGWLNHPETLVSGFGWLPPEQHRPVWLPDPPAR